MKKYFAILVAVLFVFSTFGLSFAQAPSTSPEKSDTTPVKKSPQAEKRQQMTPEKKKASESPGIAEGQAKPAGDIKGKKSEKSKKRQAETKQKKEYKEEQSKTGAVKGN